MPHDLFRDRHIQQLRRAVKENLARYTERKPWAHRKAGTGEPTFPSKLEPAVPLQFVMPESDRVSHDIENAILVHNAFPNLTRVEAGDPRLWIRLTHFEGWAYMRKRWDVGQHAEDPDKAVRYALQHYFLAGSSPSRALTRNGISRLWWYAYLTHDPARTDPYELTRVLLSTLDIAQQLLERNFGRADRVRTGFLEYLRDCGDTLGNTGREKREHIRHLAKQLNLRGGLSLLDTMEEPTLCNLLTDSSRRWRPETPEVS